jgi:uncharacterized protein involved in exopolysaccharide biosynthesis
VNGRGGEISFYDLATPLVRQWKLITALPLLFGALAAAVSLVVPPSFTASTSLVASTSSGVGGAALAGLAGLAQQLGISTGSGGGIPPEFFASVLKSREILQQVLESDFEDPANPGSTKPLLDLMQVQGESREQRLDLGIKRLRKLTATSVDARTGIVTITVTQAHPRLAAAVANRLTERLNQFSLERRQTQSRQHLQFTTERLREAQSQLRASEQALLRFLQANQQSRGAPLVEFEASRLERTLELRQEVVLALTKAFQEARGAEERDMPVLTIIDRAVVPYRRSAPHRLIYALGGVLLGLIVGGVLALINEQRAAARKAERGDYRAFAEAWGQARRDLTAMLRRSRSS